MINERYKNEIEENKENNAVNSAIYFPRSILWSSMST